MGTENRAAEGIKNFNAIKQKIMSSVMHGIKIPHITSYPVFRKMDGVYCLAVFTIFVSKNDLEEKCVNRPWLWSLFDIDTGNFIKEFRTYEKEFSLEPYDKKYYIDNITKCISAEDSEKISVYFDDIRNGIKKTGKIPYADYRKYLRRIMNIESKSLHRFYLDLSMFSEIEEFTKYFVIMLGMGSEKYNNNVEAWDYANNKVWGMPDFEGTKNIDRYVSIKKEGRDNILVRSIDGTEYLINIPSQKLIEIFGIKA